MVLNSVDLIMDLFVNRTDVYSRQYLQKNGKKGFLKVEKEITPEIIKNHLEGRDYLGVYQLDQNSLVKWGVLDFDENTPEDYQKALKIYEHSLKKGFHPLLEKSGGGDYKVHIWFFSKEKIPSKQMRIFLEGLCAEVGEKPHEIFPKQDTLEDGGYGNLVKLPLGLHLVTKEMSCFLTKEGIISLEDTSEKLKIHVENKDIIPFSEEYPPQKLVVELAKPRLQEVKTPYDDYMDTILRTELPEGISKEAVGNISGINSNILKNLAVWLKIKGYDLQRLEQEVKPLYDKRGWSFGDLRGWFKKVEKGDIMEISLPELRKWTEIYMPQLLKLLPEIEDLRKVEERLNNAVKTNLEVLTYSDLKKFKTNKNYIVQDFLLPQTITMIYSPPAQFKSLIAVGLGFAVSNGREFLGMQTKKTGVLYLDGENSQVIMKERAEAIHKGMRLKSNKFPLYFLQGGLLMDSKKKINLSYLVAIEELIKQFKIKVIVFDTLHRFCLYDENSSDDLNKLYTQVFKPLADELGVAVVFLHHSTKNGGYRGSGDFLGMVDVSYRVERKHKTNEFIIVNEKCRSGEIPEIKGELIFGDDYIRFNKLSIEEEQFQKSNKLIEKTQKIEELFDESSKLKRKDIISFLEMQNYDFGSTKSIDRALKYLVEQKQILNKTEKGFYTLILR